MLYILIVAHVEMYLYVCTFVCVVCMLSTFKHMYILNILYTLHIHDIQYYALLVNFHKLNFFCVGMLFIQYFHMLEDYERYYVNYPSAVRYMMW